MVFDSSSTDLQAAAKAAEVKFDLEEDELNMDLRAPRSSLAVELELDNLSEIHTPPLSQGPNDAIFSSYETTPTSK